ncbi:MAG: YchJ family metal-binding protein [Bacillota bacterium]
MRKVGRNDPCPCGSGRKYKACCRLYHAGFEYPDTVEQMIRSRFTAFAIGDVNYLYRTTHPDNPARAGKTEEQFKRTMLLYCSKADFTRLVIHGTEPEDENGIARGTLTAWFRVPGRPEDFFTERSEFVRVDGRLLYRDGTEIEGPPEQHLQSADD